MMRLYDLATTIRSKNAGPFRLTIDLALPDADAFRRVLTSEKMRPERIAALYDVPAGSVRVIAFERILTIKVALPRPGASSGAPADRDVYGCGQHFPLANIDV
ncbi:MAG: DUF4387 family protein [Armatimonadota bacterium]